MSCSTNENNQCCCVASQDHHVKLEVWQTRPNGLYSSVTPNLEEGICRATVPITNSKAVFTSLAPGSTGILGGMGPSSWDFMPYGAPVINMLLSGSNYHEPLLINIPIVFDNKLQPTNFFGPDFRGSAWTTRKSRTASYQIQSWNTDSEGQSIEIHLNVFMTATNSSTPLQNRLCRSKFFISPSSFFNAPIAVCAPFLLDFFEL